MVMYLGLPFQINQAPRKDPVGPAPEDLPADDRLSNPDYAAFALRQAQPVNNGHPRNIGEGLSSIGDSIYQGVWSKRYLEAISAQRAQEAKAWDAYGRSLTGGGASARPIGDQRQASIPTPGAGSSGVMAQGVPRPIPSMTSDAAPAIGGGPAAQGAASGTSVRGPLGMVAGVTPALLDSTRSAAGTTSPALIQSAKSPMGTPNQSAAPQTQPSQPTPPTPGGATTQQVPAPASAKPTSYDVDPRVAHVDQVIGDLDSQLASLAPLLQNPNTRQMAMQQIGDIRARRQQFEMQRIQLMDPNQAMQRRLTEAQIAEHEQKIRQADRMAAMTDQIMREQGIGGDAPGAAGVATSAGVSARSAGSQPPGTYAGGMVPKISPTDSGVDASFVPLSPKAQAAERLMTLGGITGNRALETAGKNILDYDPTALSGRKQSEEMGKNAATRAEAKRAGTQILKSFAQLQDQFDSTPDTILQGAIGPYNTTPAPPSSTVGGFIPNFWTMPGMTPPEAAAAYPYRGTALMGSGRSWDAQNQFMHNVHGITTAFLANAGKSLNLSDKRQEAFESAMKDFMKATDRKSAQKILNDAKGLIVNDFGLDQKEADAVIAAHIAEAKKGDGQQPAANQLKPGTVMDGHVYKGGDPANPSSWQKVNQ